MLLLLLSFTVKEKATKKLAGRRITFQNSLYGVKSTDTAANRLSQEASLLCFLLEKGVAFNALESMYFKRYHSQVGWRLPPGRDRLSESLLRSVYNMVMDRVTTDLRQLDFVSITTDAWTSVVREKFVSLTVHGVSPKWELVNHVIAVIPLDVSHTWQALTQAITERLQATLRDDTVLVATVTDNGANFVKTAAALHQNLGDTQLGVDSWEDPCEVNDKTCSWHCVAHSAQLAVTDAFEKHVCLQVVSEYL